ncbi:cell wall hydrolase [Paenibacillus tuaregi]|uniref:cell wall hydrolase n=1 Tax=Paenibacillus tuaregi TaxID=1816681 RepID=UPI0008397E4F|nr:cell wall hydrolase [Paenibacillus tuaregi]
MDLFKQNRYVALLIGAILVCVGSICLLWRTVVVEGQEYFPVQEMDSYMPMKENNQVQSASSSFVRAKTHQLPKSAVVGIPLKSKMIQQHQLLKEQQVPAVPKLDKTIPPKQIFFTKTALLKPEDQAKSTWKYALSDEELLLLQKIVMAEAEGEPYEGKVAVANVVLNRLRSANYPDTIKEVIYQKHQFSPVRNGRLKRVKPNKDTVRAVTEALYGRKEVSDDTYYFLSIKLASDLTVARTQKKTKQIGNHTFYK